VKLFRNNRIKSEACLSARIFACYALSQCNGSLSSSLSDSVVSMRVKPLLPLMSALVNVELTSLEERDVIASRIVKENRRVHFSGFDCSSTKPPVEAKVGSHEHQQDCISEMIVASDQIKILVSKCASDIENSEESSLTVRAVKSLLSFMAGMSSDTKLLRECSKVSTNNIRLCCDTFHRHARLTSFFHCIF